MVITHGYAVRLQTGAVSVTIEDSALAGAHPARPPGGTAVTAEARMPLMTAPSPRFGHILLFNK
jgi:hypothetical protein